jgi:hypothetical protein
MLDRMWWRLNAAMGRAQRDAWWCVLLFLRDRVVYRLMLLTDAEQRRAHACIKAERDDD